MTKINENVYIGNNGIQLKGLRNLTINKLFAGNIKKDVSYSVIDSIDNYKLIFIFIGTSYINGSSVILPIGFQGINIPIILRTYETSSSLTELIVSIQFQTDNLTFSCLKSGYKSLNSTTIIDGIYPIWIYGIK